MATAGAVLAGGLVGLFAAEPAAAVVPAPAVSVASEPVLAGQDASYEIVIAHEAGPAAFNVSATALLPTDVTFVDGGLLGRPVVHAEGTTLPNATRSTVPTEVDCAPLVPAGAPSTLCAVPAGSQLWVWQNVADLPIGAEIRSTLTVRPDAQVFPVGSDELQVAVAAYTSSDVTLLPTFDGSTSVATTGGHTSPAGTAATSTPVTAVDVEKTEPSPESELLRGVHLNTTTYTIRIAHTGEGPTAPVTVVDYLPAGLEYLGVGGVDSSTGGNRPEYPGAPLLDGTPAPADGPGDWDGAGETVETVALDAAQAADLGLPGPGVYTKVTWEIADLTGGTPQTYPAASGTTGEYVIRYRAGVPLYENTLWDGAPPTAQTANLDNNTGPSTRHGLDPADHDPAQQMTNTVIVTGTYAGPVDDESDRSVTARDSETIEAVDLHVLKDVDDGYFVTGELARYTLRIATSEYTSAHSITLVDEIANGLCPAFPEQTPHPQLLLDGAEVDAGEWNDEVASGLRPDDCAYPYAGAGTPEMHGATVEAIDFDTATGSFTVTFSTADLAAQDAHAITYTALQRPGYIPSGRHGATSSGDSMVNDVTIRGTTVAIDALAGTDADGEETVLDDSRAETASEFSGLTKHVLQRGETLASATADDWVDRAAEPFALGDSIWYRVRVDFADDVHTRNPVVQDYLPQGVEYVGTTYSYDLPEVGSATLTSTPPALIGPPEVRGSALTWEPGEVPGDSTDRFLPIGSWIEFFIEGRVVGQSASATVVDQPQNQAKYRQQNSDGEVFFLRDDATTDLDWGATLVKGIRDIDGTPVDGNPFGSDIDHEQVAQGDVVTFRIDVTAPTTDTSRYTVWDVLPEGIRASDVDGFRAATVEVTGVETPITGFTAAALDPGAAGYPPLDPPYAGRSVVLWEITDMIPGSGPDPESSRGLTLAYDVTIPGDAQVTQVYENLAGIVRYDVVANGPGSNGDGTTTLVPDGPLGPGPSGPELEVSGERTFDKSDVVVASPQVTKELLSTEIGTPGGPPAGIHDLDPWNGAGQIVHGELATFRYSVAIPPHTTVADGVLSDDGVFRWTGPPLIPTPQELSYELVAASTDQPAGVSNDDWAEFAFDAASGTLTFPTLYENSTSAEQVFEVEVTVWMSERDASHPDRTPDLTHDTTLTNTASFDFQDPNTGTPASVGDTASVSYAEPALSISKVANPATDVAIAEPVTYTLTVSNAAGRPEAHDAVVVDTVPAGLIVDTGTFQIDGVDATPSQVTFDPGVETGAGGEVSWTVGAVGAGGAIELSYVASIDPTTGGGASYENEAVVTAYTLPADVGGSDTRARRGDRVAADTATITAVTASIDKGVRIAGDTAPFTADVSAPIGETVEYQVEVTLEPGINYYDPIIVDELPTGVELQEATITGPDPTPADGIIGTWDVDVDDRTVTWTYTTGDGADDILSHSTARTLTLTYQVLLSADVPSTVTDLENTATFTWNSVDDDPTSSIDTPPARAEVDVLDPVLGITKTVSDAKPLPGDEFEYTVTVTNTGGSPAHNLEISDEVPTGVVVDPASIQPAGTLTGADPVTGGGTITWDATALPGPLPDQAPGNTLELTYRATLAPSAGIGDTETFTNTASVDRYESFPSGGRVYEPGVQDAATIDPAFPHVALVKEPTHGAVAHVDKEFGWTLTLRSTGDAPAETIAVTDVLPAGWTYDAGSAQISRGGTAIVPLADPTVTTAGDAQTLAWAADAVAPAQPALPAASSDPNDPTRTVVITFTATPGPGALVDAGVTTPAGDPVPHSNTLQAEVTDPTGATGNASGPYTDPPTTADAFLHSADLVVEKVGASLVAGTSGTGWTITVTNDGPDPAEAPITVSDETDPLPDGIRVTGASGDGWTCDVPDRAPDGVTTFECARTAPAPLASGQSYPDITVTVDVATDQEPTTVGNTATVHPGRTHDPDEDNNTHEADLTTTAEADLALEKAVLTADPTAGGPITWQLTPRNDGPSVSMSTGANPITITDTVPPGVNGVTFTDASGTWTATPPRPEGWNAGEQITWVYQDTQMGLGPAPTIELTGTIDPSRPAGGDIVNTATIHPGETPDPDYGDPDENNDTTVPATPGDRTTIGIAKTRVVADGSGGWRDATGDDEFVAGDPMTYRITVSNTGLADARAVQVVDEVPTGLSGAVLEEGGPQWTLTPDPAGDEDVFTLTGTLPAGTSSSFVVAYDTDPALIPEDDAVVNWAEVTAENADPDRDSDSSDSERRANLSIAKTHTAPAGGDPAVAGATVTYSLLVTNHGPSVSDGPIEVRDELPPGFSYVPGTAQVSVAGGAASQVEPVIDAGDGVLTWSVLDSSTTLALGSTIQISFEARIAADHGAQTSVLNSAEVRGPNDTDPSDDRTSHPIDVATSAVMSIDKVVAPGPWVAGTDVTYTLTVENQGPSTAADVTVEDVLPPGLSLVEMTGPGWDCSAATAGAPSGTCEFVAATGHPVGTSTITVTARIATNVSTGTVLDNAAELGWTDSAGRHSDDDDASITVDTSADVALSKSVVDASGDPVTTAVAGAITRYQLDVSNLGPSDAIAPVVVSDVLPAGMTFHGLAEASAGEWQAVADPVAADGTQTVTFTHVVGGVDMPLAGGTSAAPILVDVLIAPELSEGVALTNAAEVTSATPDPDPANNTDEVDVTVTRLVDLMVGKSHDAGAVAIGEPLAFTLAVSNGGPSVATGVTVTDRVPAGLEVLSVPGDDVGAGWTLDSVTLADPHAPAAGAVVTASYAGALAPGEHAEPLTLSTLVTVAAYDAVVNVAEVTGTEPDAEPDNNRSTDRVTVPPLSTLVVEKTAVGDFQVGKSGTYQITVENRGPTADPGPITVRDELPEGLAFTSSPDPEVEVSGRSVTWTQPAGLAIGESVTLTLEVHIGAGAYPEVTNAVVVESATDQTSDAVLLDSVTVDVAQAEPLPITGAAGRWMLAAVVALLLVGAGAFVVSRRQRMLTT